MQFSVQTLSSEDEQSGATLSFAIMSYLSIHFFTAFCYEDILKNLTVIFTMPCVYQHSVPSGTLEVFTELRLYKYFILSEWESQENVHEKEWSNLIYCSLNKQGNK